MQIELLVRGWKEMSALLRGLTLPISSRTMSCRRTVGDGWRRSRGDAPYRATGRGLPAYHPKTRVFYQNRRAEIKRDGFVETVLPAAVTRDA